MIKPHWNSEKTPAEEKKIEKDVLQEIKEIVDSKGDDKVEWEVTNDDDPTEIDRIAHYKGKEYPVEVRDKPSVTFDECRKSYKSKRIKGMTVEPGISISKFVMDKQAERHHGSFRDIVRDRAGSIRRAMIDTNNRPPIKKIPNKDGTCQDGYYIPVDDFNKIIKE